VVGQDLEREAQTEENRPIKPITKTRIGFGSCHKNVKAASPPIWNVIDQDGPLDAWLWLGDAMYPPKKSKWDRDGPVPPSAIEDGLLEIKRNASIGYKDFLRRNHDGMVVAGVWDDHDFGGVSAV
jgi:hypothetical protein